MKELTKPLTDNGIELTLIAITFISLFIHAIPPVLLAAVCLIIMFQRLDLVGIILICIYAAPKLTGAMFQAYNIPSVGGALILLAPLLVIYKCFITKQYKLTNINRAVPAVLLFFVYLMLSAFIWGNEWSLSKLLNTGINCVFGLMAYAAIFSNYKKSNFIRTGLYFFLIAFLLLLLSPLFNNGSGPSGLLDFGYLRMQNGEWGDVEVSGIIAYQQVGFVAVLGFGTLMLEELKGKINFLFLFMALLMSTIASFYAGARQFLVVSLLLIAIWTLFEKKEAASKILIPLFSIVLLVFLMSILFSSEGMLNSVLTDGYLEASKRGDRIEQGMKDFYSSPIFGIGFGCYKFNGLFGGYPHNLFVEILGELGILGILLFWIPLCRPIWSIITKLKPCLYLMLIYFLRSMASGGLDSNIFLFSYVLATYSCFVPYSRSQLIFKKKK